MKPALQPRSVKVVVRRLVPTSLSVFQDTGPVCVKVTFGYERAFKTKPARLVPGHIRTGTYDPAEQSLLQGVYHWGAVFMFAINQPETVIKIAAVDANRPADRNKLGMCHLHLLPLIQSQRVSFVGSLPLVDMTDHVVGFLDTHVILMGSSGPCRPTTSKIASSVYRANAKILENPPTFVSHSKAETPVTFVSHSKAETPVTFVSHSKAETPVTFVSHSKAETPVTFVSKSTQTDTVARPSWTREPLPSRILTRPATAPLDASLFRRPAESCEPLTPLRVLVKEASKKNSESHNDPAAASLCSVRESQSATDESTVDEFAFGALHNVRVNTKNEHPSDFFSVGKSDRPADGDNPGTDSDESSSDTLTSHTEDPVPSVDPDLEVAPTEREGSTSRCATRRIPSDWVLGSLSSSSDSTPDSRRPSRPPSRLPSEWVLHDISSSAERLAFESHRTSASPMLDGPQLIYQPTDEEPLTAPLYMAEPALLGFDTQPSYESTSHGSRVLNWIRTVSREMETSETTCPQEHPSPFEQTLAEPATLDSPEPPSVQGLIYLPSGESTHPQAPMYVPDPTMLTLDAVPSTAFGQDRAPPPVPSLPLKKKCVLMSDRVDISAIEPCSGSRRSWDSLELSSWRSRRRTPLRTPLQSDASSDSEWSTSDATDGTVLLGNDDVFVIGRRKSRGLDKASSSHDEVGVAVVMASDQDDSISQGGDPHSVDPGYSSSSTQSPLAISPIRKRVSFSAVDFETAENDRQASFDNFDGVRPELRTSASRRSSSLFSGTFSDMGAPNAFDSTERPESTLSVSSNCRDLFNMLASKDMRRQGTNVQLTALQSESESSATAPARAVSTPVVRAVAPPMLSHDVFESWKTLHHDAAEEALRRRYFGSTLSDGTEATVESVPYRSVIVPRPADRAFATFAKSKSMRHKGHHHDDASSHEESRHDSTPRRVSLPPPSEKEPLTTADIISGHTLPTVSPQSESESDSSDCRRKPLEPVCRERLSSALTDFLTARSSSWLSWSNESMEVACSRSGSDMALTRRTPRVRGTVSTPQATVEVSADIADDLYQEDGSTEMGKTTAQVSHDVAEDVDQAAVVTEDESTEMEKTVEVSNIENVDQASAVATSEDESIEMEKTAEKTVEVSNIENVDQASAVATSEDESIEMEKTAEKTVEVSNIENVDQASAVATSEDESIEIGKTTIEVSHDVAEDVDQAAVVSEDESTEMEKT
ncbi:MAG: hypothetical protein KVP17_004703, partial [Porospora cf. gigantea B]